MKIVMILGSVIAVAVIAVLAYTQIPVSDNTAAPLPPAATSEETRVGSKSLKPLTPTETSESVDSIVAGIDATHSSEQASSVSGEAAGSDSDFSSDIKAINAFDEETNAYANQL